MSRLTMRYGVEGGELASKSMTFARLWTNDTPTANFSAQTVTLSDSVLNYDGLRIVWKLTASTAVTEDDWADDDALAMAYLYDIRGKRDVIVTGSNKLNIGAVAYGSNTYARRAYFSADDALYITTASRMGASGSSTAQLIPLFIDGVRF